MKGLQEAAPGSAEKRDQLLPLRVLRIGVTGTRDAAESPRLRSQVTTALKLVTEETARLFGTPEARTIYAAAAPRLRLLSPLAEGADRIAAEVALSAGFELECPLPFPQAEYENDFRTEDSANAFRALLSRADGRVLALDGDREDAPRAYEAVGRLIVRNCDLLIGIWDGAPGHGRGGTAEIIRYAANYGPPIWWIHAKDPAARPVWVDGVEDLRDPLAAPAAERALSLYLRQLLLPPGPAVVHGHSRLQRLAHATRRHASPLEGWWEEQPLPSQKVWRAHAWFMRVTGGAPATRDQPKTPSDPLAGYWHDRYKPADDYASSYAARYRSGWLWGFVLAALSLISAAAALTAEDVRLKLALTSFEFCALGLLGWLVILDSRRGWHIRSIEYRLLAELCRTQQALAPLAWSIPGATVQSMTGGVTRGLRRNGAKLPTVEHSAWVAWLFAAWQRSAPLPIDRLNRSGTREAALADLIEDQLRYHQGRARQSRQASSTLVWFGESVFFLVILLVAVKLAVVLNEGSQGLILALGLLAAILPAVSAAFVGMRAYAELELLTEQSLRMVWELERAKARIVALRLDRAFASQDLGAEVANVATLMLQDLEGWARLFRVKVVEAG